MSVINSAAICTAIRERLDGTLTGVRAMSTGALDRGTFESQADEEKARRALATPRVDVAITSIGKNGGGALSELASVQLLRIGVRIRTTYQLPTEIMADDRLAALATARATAIDDCERIRQALGWPAGLAATSAAVATGIVTGLMQDSPSELEREDVPAGLLEWVHRYWGVVQVAPATS